MNIKDLLHGTEAGTLQIVGNMAIIPLTSIFVEDRVISPLQPGVEVTTSNYGTVVVKNTTNSAVITPSHLGIMTKAKAQDHAMTTAAALEARQAQGYNDACCVEPSQGGTIKAGDSLDMVVIPLPLRKIIDTLKGKIGYNKLWDKLSSFLRSTKSNKSGALADFYKTYADELEKFIAQFEPVPNQVGAIILVNDRVVGVERTPNYQFWLDMWRPLLRGSYAAYALQMQTEDPSPSEMREKLRIEGDPYTLEDLAQALIDADDKALDHARNIIKEELIDATMKTTVLADKGSGNISVVALSNDQFTGQVVMYNDNPAYTSLVVKDHWAKTSKLWKTRGKPFSI